MKILEKLYEHLKTKKKYNTLRLKYEVLKDEYDQKVSELNTQKKIQQKLMEIWEKKLKEQEETIIELKRRKRK